jgi:inner membrane protein
LLLLSLGEFLGFGQAYLAAGSACTLLLTLYSFWVLGGAARAGFFGLLVAGLYGAMYAILNLEQAALLIGSVLLFGVLATVMLATRRIDWHAFSADKQAAQATPQPSARAG